MLKFGRYYEELVGPLFGLPRRLPPSAWTGHIPFLFALFRITRPKTFVELGVQYGGSLIAAASACDAYQLKARVIGIDTWQGDVHTGFYEGEEIYRELATFLSSSFSGVELVRSTFDEARNRFDEGTIDVLHIDGVHTYEAVSHDFRLWRDAVSVGGVILFHDIAERERGFGVWQLWEEVKREYQHLEFFHSHGLGVAFVPSGKPLPDALALLMADPGVMESYRQLVDSIGQILPSRVEGVLHARQAAEFERLYDQEQLRADTYRSQLGKLQRETAEKLSNEAGSLLKPS